MNDKDLTKTLIGIKERIASNEKQLAKIEGQLEAVQKEIKEQYACDSIKELQKLLADKEKELADKEAEYEVALKGFQDKYSGVLG